MRTVEFMSLSLLVLLLFAVPAHSQVSFLAPTAFEDMSPFQVVQGDFYGDGRLDLVSIDANSVNLFRNEGQGHFAPAKSLATSPSGNFFFMAVVADFNDDGKPDIAVLEFPTIAASGFFLLLNEGNGTFQTTATTLLQNETEIVLAGDFTGDGKLDVAAIGSTIEVFPGNGAGGFGPGRSTTLSQTPASAVAADFNGDHKLDIAFGTSSLNGGSLFLYTGNGKGTFTAGTTISVPGPAGGLAAADVNGDGNIDLLSAISGITTAAGSVDVLIGNGDGTFQSPVAYPTPRSYSTLFLTDLNHDGQIDVIVGSGGSGQYGGAVSVLVGNGNGTFQPAINSEFGTSVLALVAGDYNGDGLTDIAFTQGGSIGGSTQVAFGLGEGHFEQDEVYAAKSNPAQAFAGNFLGTGAADILSVGNGSFELFPADGHGAFGQGAAIRVGYFYPTIGVQGDFNGDGLPDILLAGANSFFGGPPSGFQVFFGQKGSTLLAGPNYDNLRIDVSSVAAGDLNGDGVTDLVLVCDVPQASYVVALGTGGGHFQIGSPVSDGVPAYESAMGDFNGDGKPDLVLAGEGAYILFGNGDGTFQAPVTLLPPSSAVAGAVGAIDLNGDGKLDLVLAESSTLTASPGSGVCVLLGAGEGTFQKPACYPVGGSPVALAFADYNLDGKPDIATVNESGDAVSILLGLGDGTFELGGSFGVGSAPTGIAAADFNGDGKPDLVTANSQAASSISVLLNRTKP